MQGCSASCSACTDVCRELQNVVGNGFACANLVREYHSKYVQKAMKTFQCKLGMGPATA